MSKHVILQMNSLLTAVYLQGTCLKDKDGAAFCQCVGSFTGDHCETKSEFAYIAGGRN